MADTSRTDTRPQLSVPSSLGQLLDALDAILFGLRHPPIPGENRDATLLEALENFRAALECAPNAVARQQSEPLPDKARGKERATELQWLKWFFDNADFGPADSEVKDRLRLYFVRRTGMRLPAGYNYDGSGEVNEYDPEADGDEDFR